MIRIIIAIIIISVVTIITIRIIIIIIIRRTFINPEDGSISHFHQHFHPLHVKTIVRKAISAPV